jgi:hemoglobin
MALAELVSRFYARVRQDPEIGPVFNHGVHDWD